LSPGRGIQRKGPGTEAENGSKGGGAMIFHLLEPNLDKKVPGGFPQLEREGRIVGGTASKKPKEEPKTV